MVKVSGEVDVGDIRLDGTVSISGTILADVVRSRGTLEADGPVTVAGALATDGDFHTGGPVRAAQATLVGTTRIGGDVSVSGVLTLKGQFAAASIHAGEVRADGGLTVPGDIEAVDVDVRMRKDSRFGAIRAKTVRLHRTAPNPVERVFGRSPDPSVTRIEADRVELEGVDVAFVRCPEVILGRDAHITELEGTVVRRHASAHVGPRSVSPPPYGLRR
jgi:cytoskeletal protein CcmA (bactofilin family)